MPRVLVVDDDPEYRLLVRLALEPTPFEVAAEAQDGRRAVEEVTARRPDLVLLDCSMPGSDAFDVLPDLRRSCPDCQVILLSGHAPTDLRLAAQSAGALGFLSKDTPPTRLGAELAELAEVMAALDDLLVEASTRLTGDPRSVSAARRFVASSLEPWQTGTLVETVTLLVSEVVTNAIVHGGSDVGVVVQLTQHAARVEVTDHGNVPPALRSPDPDEESGRGLRLVESLARTWGVRQLPGDGKTVWFEVARDHPPPGGQRPR
jgi:CheY-like chemotaxis protein/anti-sigma regulatory factor (Ser/Thr protein kinase)